MLFDAATADILDQWQPGLGVLFTCASGKLLINDAGIVVQAVRGRPKGFRSLGDNKVLVTSPRTAGGWAITSIQLPD